jgi:hypothetical protein
MKLASHEEAEALIKQTREWAEKHTMFSSSKGAATLAAAEYTMNLQGKTLYPYMAAKTAEE